MRYSNACIMYWYFQVFIILMLYGFRFYGYTAPFCKFKSVGLQAEQDLSYPLTVWVKHRSILFGIVSVLTINVDEFRFKFYVIVLGLPGLDHHDFIDDFHDVELLYILTEIVCFYLSEIKHILNNVVKDISRWFLHGKTVVKFANSAFNYWDGIWGCCVRFQSAYLLWYQL